MFQQARQRASKFKKMKPKRMNDAQAVKDKLKLYTEHEEANRVYHELERDYNEQAKVLQDHAQEFQKAEMNSFMSFNDA